MTRFDVQKTLSPALKTDLLAIVVSDTPDKGGLKPFRGLPVGLSASLIRAGKRQKFKAKAGEQIHLVDSGSDHIGQVLLVGLGTEKNFTLDSVRLALSRVGNRAADSKAKSLTVAVAVKPPKGADEQDFAQAAAEGLVLGGYRFDRFRKSTSSQESNGASGKLPARIGVIPEGMKQSARFAGGLKRGEVLARATCLARDLSNLPANYATPSHLADQARKTASGSRQITVKIFGPAEIRKEKMGAFLAVAQGAEEPCRFIVLQYRGTASSKAPVVVVGKGVTFDTGGISLKPVAKMDEMKHDMSGAAAVIGLFAALKELSPKVNVIGLAPCTENMPSGRAYRPGDIITSRSGKTVEVLNTDAEGRMLLIDALDYAKKYKPRAIIDLATLTGACVVSLGHTFAGLISNDDKLSASLLESASRTGDLLWRLPFHQDYLDLVKSKIADLKNTGGPDAGTLTAAAFLREFVDPKTPWAHCDIAGTAWLSGPSRYHPRGATGWGVRILADYLETSVH
ncbi:MAG: leucyl aminopeptidase [Deltaproteobacteria bacterium]|nr:leucyl aminopeptidase [Deltaproteobacteria bacterium]